MNESVTYFHGHHALMAGFAQRDNNQHSAGVAPNAKVIPYHASFSWEFATAIRKARDNNVKIIGMNMAWKRFTLWSAVQGLIEYQNSMSVFTLGNTLEYQVTEALRENRIVISAAHNYAEKIEDWVPCSLANTTNLIVVGAVQGFDTSLTPIYTEQIKPTPTPSPMPTPTPSPGSPPAPTPTPVPAATFYPLKLSAEYNPFLASETDPVKSNGKGTSYGHKMIWAPGWNTEVAGNNINKDGGTIPIILKYFSGTSAATPFVTGVVSLMVSRNPNLTPKQVKDILLASDGPSIVPHPKMAAAGISANLLDVQKVMENPILWPNNGGVPDPALTFFGLVQADKTIRYNTMVAGPVKGITPPLTLLKTVSEDVWKELDQDALAKIKGWYGINAGDQPVSATEFEVLQADKGCKVPTTADCPGVKLSFAPKLTSGTVTPLPLAAGTPTGTRPDLKIVLQGENLILDLRENATPLCQLIFKDLKTGSDISPLDCDSYIVDVKNDGSSIEFRIPGSVSPPPGEYQIAYVSPMITSTVQKSNYLGDVATPACSAPTLPAPSTAACFKISSTGESSFNLTSISNTEPPVLPPRAYVWLTRDGREKPVQAGQMIGMGINAAALEQLQITIDGRDIPIREFVQQTQTNGYVLFQVPHDLEPGVKDLILKLAGNQFTFEQAIKILAMPNPVEIQQLPTTGGFGIDHSGINGDIYLGIANRREGADFNADSDVFKWDGSLFNYFQSIPTFTGSDMEFFELNASRYLAVANASGGFSKLYQWNGSQFVHVQDLRSGLNSLKHIEFNGQHFLFGSGDSALTPVAYRWNGSLFQTIQSGDLLNIGFTEHVDAFQIGTTLYAVFGVSTTSTTNPNTNSRILQWTGSRFVHTQTIPTVRAQGVEAFEMNGETYLAIANHGPINDGQADSKIYKWNGSQFNSIQNVATRSGHSWKHFHSQGVDYLALAEGGNPARFFYWDGAQFAHFRTIEHVGFWEFDFVDTGLKRLLVGSFYGAGTTYLEPSYVYEFR